MITIKNKIKIRIKQFFFVLFCGPLAPNETHKKKYNTNLIILTLFI